MTIGARLWIVNGDGAAKARHIVLAGQPRLAPFDGRRQRCQPVVRIGGDPRPVDVPVAHVMPAAPLTAAEEREYDRLDRALAGTLGESRTLWRFNALRLRSLEFPAGSA